VLKIRGQNLALSRYNFVLTTRAGRTPTTFLNQGKKSIFSSFVPNPGL